MRDQITFYNQLNSAIEVQKLVVGAVDMLLRSLVAKGRILDHVQFATLQKMRSTYTKNWESSPAGVKEGAAFANGKYRVRQTTCPAQSEWFYDFLRGLEFRMGCQSDPNNHGLLMGVIVHLLDLIRIDAEDAEEAEAVLEANELWKVGVYVCIPRMPCFVDTRGSSWSWLGFGSTCRREGWELSPLF